MLDASLTICHHSWKLFGGFKSGWGIDSKTDRSTSELYKSCFVKKQAKDKHVKKEREFLHCEPELPQFCCPCLNRSFTHTGEMSVKSVILFVGVQKLRVFYLNGLK